MAERDVLTDDQIQGYIDDRLRDRDRAAVAAYLLAHPEVAGEVETLRRQSEALKAVGQEILDEPVPERLRQALHQPKVVNLAEARRARASPFLEAAAAVLLFCAGGATGWFVSGKVDGPLQAQDLIAADAANMFAFYDGTARDYPLDFPPDRTAELISWFSRSFEREVPPPDLSAFDYEYRGGRMLPTAGQNVGFFQFEGASGQRLAVFFWAADKPPSNVTSIGHQQNVSARYWFGDGLSFAVMGAEDNPELEQAAEAVFAFYESRLGGV